MSMLESIAAKLPAIDPRSAREIDLEILEELQFHLEMRAAQHVGAGMSADEAQAVALESFGDFERIRRTCRQTQLGERIMLQRVQTALIAVLLAVVIALGYQSYSSQRANEAALASVSEKLQQLGAAQSEPAIGAAAAPVPAWEAQRPRVVKTVPANGAMDVDPATDEIRVTFDKPMTDENWSWVQSSAETFPESAGDVHYLDDMRTCVMPVKLEPGRRYVVWFNSAEFQSFKDGEGRPAVPDLLVFQTGERPSSARSN